MNKNKKPELVHGVKESTYLWCVVIGVPLILYIGIHIVKPYLIKDLENCADEFHAELYDYPKGESREELKRKYLKDLASKDLKEKVKNKRYLGQYSDCERMKEKSPKTFKLQYRK